jgi:hypothetical protein
MSLQVIPLSIAPNQNLTAALVVDGIALSLNLSIGYNSMAGYWMMRIADANNNLLLDSVPMVTGSWPAANLLEQFRYLNIGSAYVVNVSNISPIGGGGSGTGYGQGGYGIGGYGGGAVGLSGIDYPNDTNLGSAFALWWGDTPAV